ncbi:hypothetical protein HAX54_017721 [Datura stramonium]|uniref:Uncharacterized protein n=1 Tax=Datura stramonium TaxID=4076 RepID=A0ABS8S0S9_DATST|nr:hypothetical protein [Datura stramonium]
MQKARQVKQEEKSLAGFSFLGGKQELAFEIIMANQSLDRLTWLGYKIKLPYALNLEHLLELMATMSLVWHRGCLITGRKPMNLVADIYIRTKTTLMEPNFISILA